VSGSAHSRQLMRFQGVVTLLCFAFAAGGGIPIRSANGTVAHITNRQLAVAAAGGACGVGAGGNTCPLPQCCSQYG
jgi:hypothetical protein